MSTPSAICIDNNLAASQTGVRLWTANDETTRWLNVVNGITVEVLFGNDMIDDLKIDIEIT